MIDLIMAPMIYLSLSNIDNICKANYRSCTVYVTKDSKPRAYSTSDHEIYITTGLAKKLNRKEIYSVALHEVGHIIKGHVHINPKTVYQRHLGEFEADLWTTEYQIQHNIDNRLPQALEKLSGKYMDVVTSTHPSATKRIKVMKEYTEQLNNIYNTKKD